MLSAAGFDAGSAMGWQGGAAAVTELCNMAQGIAQYYSQGDMMDTQIRLAKDKIDHTEKMEGISAKQQMTALDFQESKAKMQQEMHAKGLEAKEGLAKAQGTGRELDAQMKESKLTDKQSRINQHALRTLFFNYRGEYPMRSQRNMGTPSVRS